MDIRRIRCSLNLKNGIQTMGEDIRRYNRTSYLDHREEHLARMRVYRETHKEELAASKAQWWRGRYETYYLPLKTEVMAYYSQSTPPECVRCGISDIEVLQLDHIDNNGGGRNRSIGGWRLYQRLKDEGYPENYQVLCANCNLKKELERRRS